MFIPPRPRRFPTLFVLALLIGVGLTGCSSSGASPTATTGAAAQPSATSSSGGGQPTAAATTAPTTMAPRELVVFAAASLTESFNEMKPLFEQANPGVTVTFNYAGSPQLRQQLEQGAKADVFASANTAEMDNAKKAGVIAGESQVFVYNKLVVITPKDNPGQVNTLQDLAKPGLKLVLAAPNVPVGGYARDSFKKLAADPSFGADFEPKVLANVVSNEDNVKQVVAKVQLGEADAGVVYSSDVTPAVTPALKTILIPDKFNTIATYPIALVKDAPQAALGQKFIDFVIGPDGQGVLKKYNFIGR